MQKKEKIKTAVKRGITTGVQIAATTAATMSVLTAAKNAYISTLPDKQVSVGKANVNSLLKKYGKTKASDIETDKSWADYAWDEVKRSGWG